jgi:hypothetical protein
LKRPSTIVANPSVGGLSARVTFFGSGSSMESRGFLIIIPFAFTAIIRSAWKLVSKAAAGAS